MKIAYIANSRFPSEKAQSDHIMAMCQAFAIQGHEVVLYVPDREPITAVDPFEYYKQPKTFSIKRIPCRDALRYRFLGSIGLWIQTLTFVLNLLNELKNNLPDVVYSRELYVFGFGKIAACKVWESHSLPKSFWAKNLIKKLRVVTLTNASKERLKMMGVEEKDILVQPDAVDPKIFGAMPTRDEARTALRINATDYICLYTGKFTTMFMSKGLDEAREAILNLRQTDSKVKLIAAGGTKEELTRYRSEPGISFLPHRPQAELKNFYAAADVLLMPFPFNEHYAYFMSPLKLFEYLISGIPMIVSDLPSVREIVSEKEAFFVKPGDADSLRSVILYVQNHPQEAADRATAAKIISKNYTWVKRAEQIGLWIKTKI